LFFDASGQAVAAMILLTFLCCCSGIDDGNSPVCGALETLHAAGSRFEGFGFTRSEASAANVPVWGISAIYVSKVTHYSFCDRMVLRTFRFSASDISLHKTPTTPDSYSTEQAKLRAHLTTRKES